MLYDADQAHGRGPDRVLRRARRARALPALRHRHARAHRDPARPAPRRVRRAGRHQPAARGARPARGLAGRHPRRRQGGLPARRALADPDHRARGAQRARQGHHVRRPRDRLDAQGHRRDARAAARCRRPTTSSTASRPRRSRRPSQDLAGTAQDDFVDITKPLAKAKARGRERHPARGAAADPVGACAGRCSTSPRRWSSRRPPPCATDQGAGGDPAGRRRPSAARRRIRLCGTAAARSARPRPRTAARGATAPRTGSRAGSSRARAALAKRRGVSASSAAMASSAMSKMSVCTNSSPPGASARVDVARQLRAHHAALVLARLEPRVGEVEVEALARSRGANRRGRSTDMLAKTLRTLSSPAARAGAVGARHDLAPDLDAHETAPAIGAREIDEEVRLGRAELDLEAAARAASATRATSISSRSDLSGLTCWRIRGACRLAARPGLAQLAWPAPLDDRRRSNVSSRSSMGRRRRRRRTARRERRAPAGRRPATSPAPRWPARCARRALAPARSASAPSRSPRLAQHQPHFGAARGLTRRSRRRLPSACGRRG